MLEIKTASRSDATMIKNICEGARLFQLKLGFQQWMEGYPSIELIYSDIDSQKGYLIFLDNRIIGYCVIDIAGDSEYDATPNLWQWHGRYAAVHRLAFISEVRGKGLGRQIISLIEANVKMHGISAIKIDTGLENLPMQRLLESAGYSCRGSHLFSWGQRLAYEKSTLN